MFRKKRPINVPDDNIYNEDIPDSGELSSTQKITVGVAGVCTRIGTTTQAMQIAHYLYYEGHKVAYVEMNGSGFLDSLLRRFEDVKEDRNGNITYNRLTMAKKENLRTVLTPDIEYLVFDYGSILSNSFDRISFAERNVQVLVAGVSPDELDRTTAALSDPLFNRCRLLFSFVPEYDRASVEMMMTNRRKDTFFTAYTPDMFLSERAMDKVYRQILP